MKLARTIPAGLIDAGFASLATFGVAFYASAKFEPEVLGVFALFFTAFLMAAQIPTQLFMVPAQVQSLSYEPESRLWLAQLSLTRLMLPLVLAAGLVAIAIPVAPAGTSSDTVTALAVTAFAASALSPLQDHVRRVLHLAETSWRAAAVSVVQFVGVGAALLILDGLGVDPIWVPLGALAVANGLSLGTGLALAYRDRGDRPEMDLSFRLLLQSGRWLLVGGALPAVAGFVAAGLVSRIAGSEALGFAEAARVVSQPLFVVAVGLSAVLGPRSMVAGAAGLRGDALRISRLFTKLILAAAVAFSVLIAAETVWNPAARLIPTAYQLNGLVAITIFANLANAIVFPSRSELVGGRREVDLAKVEGVASVARSATAAASGVLGAFAVPWGFAAMGVVRRAGYRKALSTHYSVVPDQRD